MIDLLAESEPDLDDETAPPYAGDQTLTRRPDSTGRRVQTDPSGRRMQADPHGTRVPEQHGRAAPAAAPDAQLAVFTEFNKKLVERLVVPNGAPHMMIEEYRKLAAALHHAQLAEQSSVNNPAYAERFGAHGQGAVMGLISTTFCLANIIMALVGVVGGPPALQMCRR